MMCLAITLILCEFVFSEKWKFLKGSDLPFQYPVQSGANNFASTNTPGSTGCSVTFHDHEELYLYGGMGNALQSASNEVLASLWRYRISSNDYAFSKGKIMGSALPMTPVYGTTFSPTNSPGSRYGSCFEEIDDYVFIFGGRFDEDGGHYDKKLFGDLWEMKISSLEWRILSTTTSFNFSTSFTNSVFPGSRYLCQLKFDDVSGKMYLFGGHGFEENNVHGRMADMYSYGMISQTWEYLGGFTTVDENGIINGDENDKPGGRSEALMWIYNGGILIWGGWGFSTNSPYYVRLNDLWSFETTDKKFTFISGSQTGGVHSSEIRGTTGVFAAANVPGPRYSAATFFKGNDYLVLVGGIGQVDLRTNLFYNDIWIFSNELKQWKYNSGGFNQSGVYGTTMNENNHIGGRYCMGHWNVEKQFYLFGGIGHCKVVADKSFCNDLFVFEIGANDFDKYNGSTSKQPEDTFVAGGAGNVIISTCVWIFFVIIWLSI